MIVIRHRNVNQAYGHGLHLLQSQGVLEQSRNGGAYVLQEPLATVYEQPIERVLFSPARNCNPWLHLMESFWMLAGRRDATWLDRYVSDFSARFAEPDGDMHGAYGHRWRQHFSLDQDDPLDQLSVCIRLLADDPSSRQVVLQMWDPTADLGVRGLRDRPCNTTIYFRRHTATAPRLDMTVCCRSNDAVWGAYGSNVVHFSILQEFIASALGIRMGSYTQISNNFHVYKSWIDQNGWPDERHAAGRSHDLYTRRVSGSTSLDRPTVAQARPMFGDISSDWPQVLSEIEEWCHVRSNSVNPRPVFSELLTPMSQAHDAIRERRGEESPAALSRVAHTDWQTAASQWEDRRRARRLQKIAAEDGL